MPLIDYQRAKTGALFVGATLAGAAAAGADREPWRALGQAIGEAYQVADDLRDVLCDAEELGKPIGQDAGRLRPNAAAQLGVGGAKARLERAGRRRVGGDPDCPGAAELRTLIRAQTARSSPSSSRASRPEMSAPAAARASRAAAVRRAAAALAAAAHRQSRAFSAGPRRFR